MPDQTSALSLPLILPSQAQKHVTHNEALRILDVAVQLAVLSRSLTDPPANPAEGDRYIIKGPATGAWEGRARQVAIQTPDGWEFHLPRLGWQAYVADEGQIAAYDGVNWVALGGQSVTTEMLGVNTVPDPVNRLSVKGDAALFDADGSGMQVKINKNGINQTASLLFQYAFDARAEIGLLGDNNLTLKVSPDGTQYLDGLLIERETARVQAPVGLRTGNGTAAEPALAFLASTGTGLFASQPNEIGMAAGGIARAVLSATGLDAVNLFRGGSQVYSQNNVVGTVSRSGGLPTGALVEMGANANGNYLRLAGGLQVAWGVALTSATEDVVVPLPVTFTAPLTVVPVARANTLSVRFAKMTTKALSNFGLRVLDQNATRITANVDWIAIGLWHAL